MWPRPGIGTDGSAHDREGVGRVLGPPLFGTVATFLSYETAFLGGSVLAFAAAGLVGMRLVESRTHAPRAVTADD